MMNCVTLRGAALPPSEELGESQDDVWTLVYDEKAETSEICITTVRVSLSS